MAYTFCISETDAKTKLCCDGGNASGVEVYKCVASRCMAWRWVQTHIYDDEGNLTILSGDTHGYCGLAGPLWNNKP